MAGKTKRGKRANVGRPAKPAAKRLRNRLMVSFTDAEIRSLEKKAGGRPMSEVIREIVLRSLKRRK
jgi:hypothetical protein